MFQKVKQNRIFERIVEQILEAIFRGDLTPNDKLPSENELTQIFGVSRVTVREAIRALEQDGVIEVRQGVLGGAYIKEMDLDNVVERIENVLQLTNVTFQQLAEARAILEKIILCELIPSRMKKEDLDRMDANIETAKLHFKNDRNSERLLANFEFHTIMTEMSGNPIIILMHKLIVNLSIYFFENVEPSVPMIKKTFKDHKRIVELLKRGELKSASDVCSVHIKEVSARIVEKSKRQSLLDRYK
jgi:GntR family transcriptional regulator, transcriptional repressor for pyruvate dehydrogenase complex